MSIIGSCILNLIDKIKELYSSECITDMLDPNFDFLHNQLSVQGSLRSYLENFFCLFHPAQTCFLINDY